MNPLNEMMGGPVRRFTNPDITYFISLTFLSVIDILCNRDEKQLCLEE